MDADTFFAFAVIILICLLVVLGANYLERRWRRMHPPDNWDGMREDKDNDEHL